MAKEKKMELEMTFDPNTISHLGIQMYSTLPPVIAELVSNSYDADAHKVMLLLNDSDSNNKTISVEDDGHGMTFDEINNCFLLIGRNRREGDNKNQKTRSGKRYVIGKKGIGKLAFFGIARTIEIITISNGLLNSFVMDWEELKKSRGIYKPKILIKDKKTTKKDGTKITLKNIQRKNPFEPHDIAISLAKTFSIFDKNDFNVSIKHNNENKFEVKNKYRFENINRYKEWKFPFKHAEFNYTYSLKEKIKGEIIASTTPVSGNMRGIALYSRGKLVNEHTFFEIPTSSFGYSYLTGWLDVDFIDDWKPDVISTNRQSLNWEDERCIELKHYLEAVIPFIYTQRRNLVEVDKKKDIKKITGINIDTWVEELPAHDRTLAKKLIKAIVSNDGIENNKAAELTSFVKDSFQFTAFKELASEMKADDISNAELLQLMNEWKVIEAREMYKLAEVRVQTIKKFQENIDNDAKEVPVMHNFFVQFPWLLDPRIMSFKDEVRYSTLLRENFNDNSLPEVDRRLDFLCHNFVGQLFIIELKRPSKVLSSEELEQAMEYVDFIQKHIGNENINKVTCFLIGKKISDSSIIQRKAKAYRDSADVIVRTYDELLAAAMKYHSEFIEKYKELNKIK